MFLSYAYFFLLDEVWYVNHTYLICLFCFLMIFVPAHRALSIDAWVRPSLRSNTAPAWSLWLLRFQIGVVYFFAGLAKFSPDCDGVVLSAIGSPRIWHRGCF
jgi:vitamin K-dependent gamma-carboxylase